MGKIGVGTVTAEVGVAVRVGVAQICGRVCQCSTEIGPREGLASVVFASARLRPGPGRVWLQQCPSDRRRTRAMPMGFCLHRG